MQFSSELKNPLAKSIRNLGRKHSFYDGKDNSLCQCHYENENTSIVATESRVLACFCGMHKNKLLFNFFTEISCKVCLVCFY